MQKALEAITEANNTAGIRTLAFANIQEFQAFQDSFRFEEWPVNVVLPFSVNGTLNMQTGIIKSVIPLQGWVLTRITSEPNLYRSVKIEEKYMEPMRVLAKKFLRALSGTQIIDPEVQSFTYTLRPEYMFLNNLVFGVAYSANIGIQDNVC